MSFLRKLMITALMGISFVSVANDTLIEKKLATLGMQATQIEESPIKGVKIATTNQGVMFISEDGNYLLHGELYDLTSDQPVKYMVKKLIGKIDGLKDQMIVYPAKNEKFVITVFTDITCGYCQKLHQQMSEYNDLGITIRYLAFPRQGADSENAVNMQSVWCMADRNKAFDLAERGEIPAPATCGFDIRDHYRLGNQMGVSGTPAIITPNSNLVPGYLPPKDMLAMLESE